MNPVPLTAPNGTVYTYACGKCHNVKGGIHAFGMAEGPEPDLADTYRDDATACCMCRDCKVVETDDYLCPDCRRRIEDSQAASEAHLPPEPAWFWFRCGVHGEVAEARIRVEGGHAAFAAQRQRTDVKCPLCGDVARFDREEDE